MFSPERSLRPRSQAESIGNQILSLLHSIEHDEGTRRRRRSVAHQRTFEATVSALVANLLYFTLADCAETHTGLGIRLGKSANALRPARYREECERGQLPYVLSLMAHPNARIVAISKGKRGATSRTATTVLPGAGLVTLVHRASPFLSDITRRPPREAIVMKAPRSRDPQQRRRAATWLDYRDTPQAAARRTQMERLNARLSAADLSVGPGAWPEGVGRIAIDLQDRYVVRFHNNARWDHGGRLFGGFWQTMPSATRAALRIGGEPVVIVDYASLFPRLLYAQYGLDVDPSADLYRVPGFEQHREGIKKVMASLLFREGHFERLPQGSRALLPNGTKAAEVEKAVRLAHPGIEQHFGKDVGFGLMHTESELLLAVLEACSEVGIVALPLHDAVLVAQSRGQEAKGIMEAIYRQVTRQSPSVSIKRPALEVDTLHDSELIDVGCKSPSLSL